MNAIIIRTNTEGFDYDIHSLIKAFFPAYDVRVLQEDAETPTDLTVEKNYRIEFTDESITMSGQGASTKSESIAYVDDRSVIKSILKRTIYEYVSEETGRELPWGTLTGIRPTKIPMGMIEEGADDETIRRYMLDTYYCSEEKTNLAIDIAHYERSILSGIDYENGYSLYIGIPFCPSTCLYCSFTSYPISLYRKMVGQYIEAVKKEIDYVAEAFRDKTVNSIYVGGGTPTTLEPEELRELIGYVEEKLNLRRLREFTVEAGRADSITREKLMTLLSLGVTRISVNPQTMNEDTLKLIGRKATAAATVEAYKLAREVGFDNINMDMIVGLPGEDIDVVEETLQKISELRPDSLTVHSLAIKRASRLAQVVDELGYETLKNTDEIMKLTTRYAMDMGLKPYYLYRQKNMAGNYENVGYATPGKAGIYNILIMEEVQTIVALGAGTVSKRVYGDGRIERCDTVKDVKLYIEKIDEMIERKKVLFGE